MDKPCWKRVELVGIKPAIVLAAYLVAKFLYRVTLLQSIYWKKKLLDFLRKYAVIGDEIENIYHLVNVFEEV